MLEARRKKQAERTK